MGGDRAHVVGRGRVPGGALRRRGDRRRSSLLGLPGSGLPRPVRAPGRDRCLVGSRRPDRHPPDRTDPALQPTRARRHHARLVDRPGPVAAPDVAHPPDRRRRDDRPSAARRLHPAQPRRPGVLRPQGDRLGAPSVRPGRSRLGSWVRRRAPGPDVRTLAPRGHQAPDLTRRTQSWSGRRYGLVARSRAIVVCGP